jgi:hypothetical protein
MTDLVGLPLYEIFALPPSVGFAATSPASGGGKFFSVSRQARFARAYDVRQTIAEARSHLVGFSLSYRKKDTTPRHSGKSRSPTM